MSNTDLGGAPDMPRRAGGGDGGSLKDMAGAAVETVKAEAQSFAETAQHKAADVVGEHRDQATRTLTDFAGAIRRAGDDLAQHDQSVAGRMVKQAADGLEGFARSVTDKRPEELLDAVRDFGRRNPAAFIAGSVLLGFALGRLAKSSEQHAAEVESAAGMYRADLTGPYELTPADPAPSAIGASTIDPATGVARSGSERLS